MNFGFSGEMIFLFFLALILFGPKKLPEIGRQIGRIMNEFRRASNEFRSQIESEINTLESQSKPQILPPLQAPLGSLASRILNPPTPERLAAAEPAPAELAAAEPAPADPAPIGSTSGQPAPADNPEKHAGGQPQAENFPGRAAEIRPAPPAAQTVAVEAGVAASPAPKVAPDA